MCWTCWPSIVWLVVLPKRMQCKTEDSLVRTKHIEHLKLVFGKCRLYRICLNPNKCKLMVRQGKILGHIVSQNGILTDAEKIIVIIELPRPIYPKDVQIFMGHCGWNHLRADHLSRITSREPLVGVDNDLLDDMLFMVEIPHGWAEPILSILMTGFLDTTSLMEDAMLNLEKCKHYVLVLGQLYKRGSDEVLCLCINPNEYVRIIHHAHVSVGGMHLSSLQTARRVM